MLQASAGAAAPALLCCRVTEGDLQTMLKQGDELRTCSVLSL